MLDDQEIPGSESVETPGRGRRGRGNPREEQSGRGRLFVFLGAAPGTGKTFAMLVEGQRLAQQGLSVVVGLVETHGRQDTDTMLESLEQIPLRRAVHRGTAFDELDVDALLERHPDVVLVDELAHRCVPGSRHEKRWEDVEELLDAGIDVVTALNVQHLDSLNEAVEGLTGVQQSETVPDAVVAAAERVEFVDLTPEQLRGRIAHSDVLGSDVTEAALAGYFSEDRIRELRQLAMSWLQENELLDPQLRRTLHGTFVPPTPGERVVVALTGTPEAEHVLRRASLLARSTGGELIGVYVRIPSETVEREPPWLVGQRRMLSELGGRYTELAGVDVASLVLDFARSEGATQLVLGATRRSRVEELLHGSVINKAIRAAGQLEVHVIPRRHPRHLASPSSPAPTRLRRVQFPAQRRVTAWILAVVLPLAITCGLIPVRSSIELSGVLLCNLLGVVAVALLGGIRPAVLSNVIAFVVSDFFYAPPFYSLRVARLVDLMALITFVIVAAAVGGLVDLSARQGVRVARVSAEGENLARLAADAMVSSRGPMDAVAAVRRTFELDCVSLFCWEGDAWRVVASDGEPALLAPDTAPCSIEIGGGYVLALSGARLQAGADTDTLLHTFLDQLRIADERTRLEAIRIEPRNGNGTGRVPP